MLKINADRFKQDFDQLSQIGALPEGGVSRPAFSPAHLEARQWFRESAEQAGLSVHVDGAGNHFARLDCGPAGAPTLLIGSHLDSVPSGGRYDGALGVLAALETLRAIKEADLELPFHLEAVDFSDEEGVLVSFLGSFALSGKLKADDLEKPRGTSSELHEGLRRAGLTTDSLFTARRDPKTIAGYLELHIEQGGELENYSIPIGVVTQIAGIAFFRLVFIGSAGHAGTIPMTERRDAAHGAAEFILSVRRQLLKGFPECFANVGRINLEPGTFNTVPERATLAFELRAADVDTFRKLEAALLVEAQSAAQKFHLDLQIEPLGNRKPARMHPAFQNAIRKSANDLTLDTLPVISRAGHDAQAMAESWPTGMIFVPSHGGISHSQQEYTAWGDCVNGANVLANTVLRLANSYPWEQL